MEAKLVITSLDIGGGRRWYGQSTMELPRIEMNPGDSLVLSDGKGGVLKTITYEQLKASITDCETKVIDRGGS